MSLAGIFEEFIEKPLPVSMAAKVKSRLLIAGTPMDFVLVCKIKERPRNKLARPLFIHISYSIKLCLRHT
jgi:hypothetical protein